MMSLFPGLGPEHPLPSMTVYVAFLADRRSTWFLLDLVRARFYFELYFTLNRAIIEAEQRQDTSACAQLQEEAGRTCTKHGSILRRGPGLD